MRTKTLRMPEELNLLVNLGKVCFDLGEYEESLQCFQSAVRIGPDEIEALAGLAGAAWQLNKSELCQQAYAKAYMLKPLHPGTCWHPASSHAAFVPEPEGPH